MIKRPTVAHEVLVAGIYKAMARSWHSEAAVEVTVPGVLEPGAEFVVKNETDHPHTSRRRPARKVKAQDARPALMINALALAQRSSHQPVAARTRPTGLLRQSP